MDDDEICYGKVVGEQMRGFDYGDEVSDWLSNALGGKNLRLVQQIYRKSRNSENSNLSNVAPYLVLNRESARMITNELKDLTVQTVLNQFRGYIVIDGCPPNAEDHWNELHIGGVSGTLIKHSKCLRCTMIVIDQKSGERDRQDLFRHLKLVTEGAFSFGVLFNANLQEESSVLKVGSPVVFN